MVSSSDTLGQAFFTAHRGDLLLSEMPEIGDFSLSFEGFFLSFEFFLEFFSWGSFLAQSIQAGYVRTAFSIGPVWMPYPSDTILEG